MQNHDPEIQAKLLAMQKQMSTSPGGGAAGAGGQNVIKQLAVQQAHIASLQGREKALQAQYQQQIVQKQQQIQQAQLLESIRAKHKALSQDQKEEQAR